MERETLTTVTVIIGRLAPDDLRPGSSPWWEAQQHRLIAATAPYDVITMGSTCGTFRGRVEDQYVVVCVMPAWRASGLAAKLADRFERTPAVIVAPCGDRGALWP